jgi:hypothetical protein
MTDDPHPVVVESSIEHALAGGEPQRVNRIVSDRLLLTAHLRVDPKV